jgi:hypothetical protein
MLSLLHMAALSRSDAPPSSHKRFHVFCDEAHRFITDAIEDLIAETRKYNVSLTLAHQYMSQFSTPKADAISSVGSTIMFRVNSADAAYLRKNLQGKVDMDVLTGLPQFKAIARIGTDIVRIKTCKPRPVSQNHACAEIVKRSRERYYRRVEELKRARRHRECFEPLSVNPLRSAEESVDERPEMYEYEEL